MTESLELTDALEVDGWQLVRSDCLLWLHYETRTAVSVIGPIPRREAIDVPSFGALEGGGLEVPTMFERDIDDPSAPGFVLSEVHHDERGQPVECVAVWISSRFKAIECARDLRSALLARGAAR